MADVTRAFPAAAPALRSARAIARSSEASSVGFAIAAPHGARLGARADDAFEIAVTGASGGAPIAVRRAEARGVAGRLEDGVVIYEGAFAGADVIDASSGAGLEELVVARSAEARVAYDVALPSGWSLHQDARLASIVEMRDGRGLARARVVADAAWDASGARVGVRAHVDGSRITFDVDAGAVFPVAIDPEWKDSGTMVLRRSQHTATLLSDGRVLIVGGDLGNSGVCEIYDPQSGGYTTTGTMAQPRAEHAATLLPNGTVLVTGGHPRDDPNAPAYASAEIYEPDTGTFKATGNMTAIRYQHAATPLQDGTVLITGGLSIASSTSSTIFVQSPSAEIFDPKAGKFAAVPGAMTQGRAKHSATLLRSGQVLIVGGGTTADLYDPQAHKFSATGALTAARTDHAATALPSGDVLVVGGGAAGAPPAERYAASSGTFTPITSDDATAPIASRLGLTATLLPSGEVLVVGGHDITDATEAGIAAHEIFDGSAFKQAALDTGTDPAPAVWGHTATLLPSGRVLVTGGEDRGQTLVAGTLFTRDVITRIGSSPMRDARAFHGAAPLADGRVLLVGGVASSSLAPTASAEIYDPATDSYTPTGSLVNGRYGFATAVLASGKVLVVGGADASGLSVRSAEIYDPAQGTFTLVPRQAVAGRIFFTATRLASGQVLLVGGHGDPAACGAEIFDPNALTFTCTTPAHVELRKWHTATLLKSGKVLVAGGWTGDSSVAPVDDAELYDPGTGAFTAVSGKMTARRFVHAATLLDASGKVLLAGGARFDPTTSPPTPPDTLQSAELYDPGTDSFTAVAQMTSSRAFPVMTPLQNGQVLVAGGGTSLFSGQFFLQAVSTAELYDPTGQAFSAAGSMSEPRVFTTITPLQDGGALVVGGASRGFVFHNQTPPTWTSDRFDPASKTFTPAGQTAAVGESPILVALPDNRVLVAGGLDASQNPVTTASLLDPANPLSLTKLGSPLMVPRSRAAAVLLDAKSVLVTGGATTGGLATASAERYDVAARTFAATGSMTHARAGHTVTLLPSGEALVVGGRDEKEADVAEAEVYDPKQGAFSAVGALNQRRSNHTAALLPSGQVLIAGGQATGQSEPPGLELYDPSTKKFTVVPSPFIAGVSSSTPLASGDVFLAGDGLGLRYAWDHPGFQFFYTASSPFGAQTLVTGDVVVCGADECDWLGAPIQRPWMSARSYTSSSNRGGASEIRLPSTKLLVLAPTARGNPSYSVAYQTSQVGAIAPAIDSVSPHPAEAAGGLQVTVQGRGFTRSTAKGSEGTTPDPSIVPVVAFLPAQGGGPVFSRVVSWSDTSLEWRVPTTSYHGPGWLHVITNGVPSEGRFLELPATSDGASCAFDSQCTTGFCSAGADIAAGTICCDRRCDGPCESCRAKDQGPGGVDGVCGPIAVDTDPKNACTQGPAETCQQTGLCDGKGACTCVQCRSTLDCLPGEICAPDGRCEPYREATKPTDPGCSTTGDDGSANGPTWMILGVLGWVSLRAARKRAATKISR